MKRKLAIAWISVLAVAVLIMIVHAFLTDPKLAFVCFVALPCGIWLTVLAAWVFITRAE